MLRFLEKKIIANYLIEFAASLSILSVENGRFELANLTSAEP